MNRYALAILLTSSIAVAEEPCRPDGDAVVCQRAAFDKLMAKIIDARARADVFQVKLEGVIADRDDVQKALDACAARPPCPPPPSALRTVVPVIVAAVGAAILTTSVTVAIDAGGRATGAVVGLAAVGTGIVLALP